jgi:hypothetical protein
MDKERMPVNNADERDFALEDDEKAAMIPPVEPGTETGTRTNVVYAVGQKDGRRLTADEQPENER